VVKIIVSVLLSFYRTGSFIIAFTTTGHLFVSWATLIQSMPSPQIFISILILFYCGTYALVSKVTPFG